MTLTFPTPVTSLIRFAQMMAERLAVGLRERLGIGRFGYTVFLPREEHERLDADLNYIETVTRRALFLIAATFGPLPPLDSHATPPVLAGPAPYSPLAVSGAPRALRFRLTETQRARDRETRGHHHPAQAEWAKPPREAPATLLPAGQLVRRYQALETVFENPWPHIERMRRLIGEKPGKLLPYSAQADAPGAHIPRINRRIIRALQAQVDKAALRLETG